MRPCNDLGYNLLLPARGALKLQLKYFTALKRKISRVAVDTAPQEGMLLKTEQNKNFPSCEKVVKQSTWKLFSRSFWTYWSNLKSRSDAVLVCVLGVHTVSWLNRHRAKWISGQKCLSSLPKRKLSKLITCMLSFYQQIWLLSPSNRSCHTVTHIEFAVTRLSVCK